MVSKECGGRGALRLFVFEKRTESMGRARRRNRISCERDVRGNQQSLQGKSRRKCGDAQGNGRRKSGAGYPDINEGLYEGITRISSSEAGLGSRRGGRGCQDRQDRQ